MCFLESGNPDICPICFAQLSVPVCMSECACTGMCYVCVCVCVCCARMDAILFHDVFIFLKYVPFNRLIRRQTERRQSRTPACAKETRQLARKASDERIRSINSNINNSQSA